MSPEKKLRATLRLSTSTGGRIAGKGGRRARRVQLQPAAVAVCRIVESSVREAETIWRRDLLVRGVPKQRGWQWWSLQSKVTVRMGLVAR